MAGELGEGPKACADASTGADASAVAGAAPTDREAANLNEPWSGTVGAADPIYGKQKHLSGGSGSRPSDPVDLKDSGIEEKTCEGKGDNISGKKGEGEDLSDEKKIHVEKSCKGKCENNSGKKGEGEDLSGKKGEGEDLSDEKNIHVERPLWKKAEDDANKALEEVKNLHAAALLENSRTIPSKMTKKDLLRSYTADLISLAEVAESSNGTATPSSLPYGYNEPCCKGRRRGYVQKKRGIDLVIWRGNMAIPSCSIAGNMYVDRMNAILFKLYTSVNSLLVKGHSATLLAKLGYLGKVDSEKDREDAVHKLRSTCHTIRSRILELGGLPLLEPTEYWRKEFPLSWR